MNEKGWLFAAVSAANASDDRLASHANIVVILYWHRSLDIIITDYARRLNVPEGEPV